VTGGTRRLALSVCAVLASGGMLALCGLMERPWFALIFVALVPWLAVLDAAPTLRASLASALAMALAMTAFVFAWFADAIVAYTGAPLALAWLVLLLLAPILEPQLFVFAAVRSIGRRDGRRGRPVADAGGVRARKRARAALAAALAWVGAEWALPKLFADSLGHGLLPAPWLLQAGELAGVGGLTLVVLLVNEAVLAMLRAFAAALAATTDGERGRPRVRAAGAALAPAAVAAALVGVLALYGALRLRSLEAEIARAPQITAGIAQADIARYGELARALGSFDAVAEILEAHFALSHAALGQGTLDLLLWPETVYPTTFGAPKSPEGEAFDRALGAFVGRTGIPLVFGAYDAEDGREYNAAVLLEPDGPDSVRFATYRKAALFPLTERVPDWLDGPRVRAALPWLGTWSPPDGGERSLPLALDGRSVRVAPLICYDALEPGLVREAVREGAELIVTLSNDAWFAYGAGPRLHLAMAAFRSLETRRAQLRATPTGISAAISPTGEITAQLAVHAREALVATVPLLSSPPGPFARFGDWLGPSAAALAAALSVLGTPRRATK
jgi:apolipoprotein N-acyltransferase